MQVFFAVSSRRAEHIALEDFRIIAGTGETDLNGDLCNGEIVILQKSETLLNTVAQKKVKGRLVQRLLEQTAEFAFAGMAGISNFAQCNIAGVIFVDESESVFQPLDLPFLGRCYNDIRIKYELPIVDLIDQIP